MNTLIPVPNSGTYGELVNIINGNFTQVQEVVTRIENAAIKDVGYYQTLAALQAKYPAPVQAGLTAKVLDTTVTPNVYKIYDVVSSAWHDTGVVDTHNVSTNFSVTHDMYANDADKALASDALKFDDAPVAGSTKIPKSGGVKAALDAAVSNMSAQVASMVQQSQQIVNNAIAELEGGIEERVLEQNQEQFNAAVASVIPIEIAGDVTNAPDEEDLTSVNVGGTDVLKLKDKLYSPITYSGMGRVYLRKNLVNGVNTLTQDMFYKGEVGSRVPNENTIYHIQYDFTLGEDITVPADCVLEFDGGKINNGSITFDNTEIKGSPCFEDSKVTGTIINKTIQSYWFITDDFGDFSDLLRYNAGITLILSGTYNISRETIISDGTKIIGTDNGLSKLVDSLDSSGTLIITRQENSPSFANVQKKKSFANYDVEISNITIKVNNGYFLLRDTLGLKLRNISLISDKDSFGEYPKFFTISGCSNVLIENCYSNKVPLTRTEYCYNVNAINNNGDNISSTFIELCMGYSGSIKNNYVKCVFSTNLSVIASNSSDIVVSDNTIKGNDKIGYGINIGHSGNELIAENNLVYNNYADGLDRGLLVQNAKNLIIKSNHFSGVRSIYFTKNACDKVIVEDNVFDSVANATQTGDFGDYIYVTDEIQFKRNKYTSVNSFTQACFRLYASGEGSTIVVDSNVFTRTAFKTVTFVASTIMAINNSFTQIEEFYTVDVLRIEDNSYDGYHNTLIRKLGDNNIFLSIKGNNYISQSVNNYMVNIRTTDVDKNHFIIENNDFHGRDLLVHINSDDYYGVYWDNKYGTTSQRPPLQYIKNGFEFFDKTLEKPIYKLTNTTNPNGVWVDATGTPV